MRQFTTYMESRTPGIRVCGSRITGTFLGQMPTVAQMIWRVAISCDVQVVSAPLIHPRHTLAMYQRKQVQP